MNGEPSRHSNGALEPFGKYQYRVCWASTCSANNGFAAWRTNACASLTNAAVKRLPAPIRNPRRDCSIKKSSKMAHASGGLATYCCPCGPHRRATVAGLRLVGGTVRSSQDAKTILSHRCLISKQIPSRPHMACGSQSQSNVCNGSPRNTQQLAHAALSCCAQQACAFDST